MAVLFMPGNTHDCDYVFLFELHAIQKRDDIRVQSTDPVLYKVGLYID